MSYVVKVVTRVLNIVHDAAILFLTWYKTRGGLRDIASQTEARGNVVTKMLLNGNSLVHLTPLGANPLVDPGRCYLLRASQCVCTEWSIIMTDLDYRVHLVLNIVDAVLTVTGASISLCILSIGHFIHVNIHIVDL